MDKGRLRRAFLVLLMLLGGVLMITGAFVESPSVSVAGAGAWMLVIIALLWGMRFRFEQASRTASGLRDELFKVRRSQLMMHGRVSTRLRDHRIRFERIRESQLKLHSRMALQESTIARQHESLLKQVRTLLEDGREASSDAQRLTLRAYRESHEEWTRVGALLAEQQVRGEKLLRTSEGMFQQLHAAVAEELAQRIKAVEDLAERISERLDSAREATYGISQQILGQLVRHNEAQQQLVEQVMAQLHLIATETRKTPEMIDRLTEEARGDLNELSSSLARAREDIRGVRGEADRSTGMLKKAEAAIEDLGKAVSAIDNSWAQGKSAIILKQRKSRQEILQSIEAISQLNKLVDLKAPYPLLDGWAMDPISMLSLLQQVMNARPRLILECGSGTSTVWLAAALREIGSGRLVSLDHLEDYAQHTRAALADQGLEDFADVRCAPLVQVELADESVQWYDPVTVSDVSGVDLLVVDGPPKGAGPQARYPALPLVASKLSDGALIVLDDTDRPEEAEILERWRQSFPELSRPSAAGPRTAVLEWRARARS